MYLVRYTNSKGDKVYMLVVIDSTTNQRVKRFVKVELAIELLNIGIKCYETINQEVSEI